MNDQPDLSPDIVDIPLFARALNYWNSLREGDRLPARRNLRPRDIVDILPHIVLNDVVPGAPDRYRYRLVGTRVAEYYGFDPTGRMLDEVAGGEFHDSVVRAFARCRETRQPQFEHLNRSWSAIHRYSRLILPLAEDGKTVDIIMVVVLSSAEPVHRNPMRDFFRPE